MSPSHTRWFEDVRANETALIRCAAPRGERASAHDGLRRLEGLFVHPVTYVAPLAIASASSIGNGCFVSDAAATVVLVSGAMCVAKVVEVSMGVVLSRVCGLVRDLNYKQERRLLNVASSAAD